MSDTTPKEIRFEDGPREGDLWETDQCGTPPDVWVDPNDASVVYELNRFGFSGEWFLKYRK